MPPREPLSRERVVQAAMGLLDEDPSAAATLGVNALARRLNIKPPSLYNHVAGNDDLRAAVAIEGWRRLGEFFAEAEGDPGARLRGMAAAYRRFAHAHPALYQLMSTVPIPPDDPAFAEVAAPILARFRDLFGCVGLDGDVAIHATRTLRAALHGFVLLEIDGQLALGPDPDDTFAFLVDRVVTALVPREPA